MSEERIQLELTHGEARLIQRHLGDWIERVYDNRLNVLPEERSILDKLKAVLSESEVAGR